MSETSAPPTPGLKYRHYAPSTPVFLLSFPSSSCGEEGRRGVEEVIGEEVGKGKRVVVVKLEGREYGLSEDVAEKVAIFFLIKILFLFYFLIYFFFLGQNPRN